VAKLAERLETLRARGEKALVTFVTAGDPSLGDLPAIVDALVEGGSDVVEVGIPFSDPFGEGPTIQLSSQRALDAGVTPKSILAALSGVRADVPLVPMGYYNPVLRFGLREFAFAATEAGASGTIISDLVPDEAETWAQASADAGLDTVFLAAPTSTETRIQEVASLSTGFVYAVSRTGVTGAESAVPPEVQGLVARIRAETERPICVGFGISKPEHVRMVCEVADGAVVGSALVSLLHRRWNGGAGRDEVIDFVRQLKAATR
jgi:tryptophan synthase alpha chain